MKYKFDAYDLVQHRNGTQYQILFKCTIEKTLVPCYAYRKAYEPDAVIWIRPEDEMEDGRFFLISKGTFVSGLSNE